MKKNHKLKMDYITINGEKPIKYETPTVEKMREMAEYMEKMKIAPMTHYILKTPDGETYFIPTPVHQTDPRARLLLTQPIFKTVEVLR
jgi:hypothetical protein